MEKLNLNEALESAKNGETVYSEFYSEDENKYFTLDMLVEDIIFYYCHTYKYRTNIDTNLEGWVDSIIDFVKEYEEDFKEWYDEEKDKDFNNMDDFFTKEYVEDYVKETIYLDYEVFSEETLQELYNEENGECEEIEAIEEIMGTYADKDAYEITYDEGNDDFIITIDDISYQLQMSAMNNIFNVTPKDTTLEYIDIKEISTFFGLQEEIKNKIMTNIQVIRTFRKCGVTSWKDFEQQSNK